MKKVFVLGLLLVFALGLSVCAKSQKTKEVDVKSTVGVEVSEQSAQIVDKSKFNDKPAKQKQKIRNKYLKSLKKIDKTNYKKHIKQRNLEFYNKRLEIKKQKLEELNSDENEKGEKEQ